jgi:hypothetical protein
MINIWCISLIIANVQYSPKVSSRCEECNLFYVPTTICINKSLTKGKLQNKLESK